ncbi:aspartate carbamoyltransferase regulatory subunit [Oceanivirga miroungae]|uniref:Aspartate carbamoyltransferase, regulatory subunit n=1 Tax=Oceanivirga miroungae TaxID=1130046 RepID=A0A6I8MDD0_9FUSO|nr:aspartate carbamoyltransferase regulatory subunit [Oceanivirga miroungae]VWL85515.1 aspartate carbamoyltransferase, regulatory subunit [Oceanivirga miroungae]
MLNVNSIKKGIVIDHIKAGYAYEIFKLLELDKTNYKVALIMNVDSKKNGVKDMIKIDNVIDINHDILGLIDANLTVNIIENEKIISKSKIKLPEVVYGFIKCKNPRCVTMHEKVVTRFILEDEKNCIYRCHFCDHYRKMGVK